MMKKKREGRGRGGGGGEALVFTPQFVSVHALLHCGILPRYLK